MFHLMKRSFINDSRRSSRLSNVSAREPDELGANGQKKL
jgi:hypothetical protein